MATAQLTATGVSIRNVLIATDFSQHSNHTLQSGLNLCRTYGAQAFILYVLPRDEFMMAGAEAYAAARDAARRDLLDLKQQLRAKFAYVEGEDYQLLLSEGDVADGILDCAREKHTDLIVLGTHGRSGFTRAILGSVAERVFRHSTVPVLTIGPHVHAHTALRPKRVLVPVDFTPASRYSAAYALEMAREHHAELTLLHVVQHPTAEALADVDCLKHGIEQSLSELAHCDNYGLDIKVRAAVGKVVPVILNTAMETDADLMVLGVHTYPGLLNRLRWQVAYELVSQAPCPVLTIRESAAMQQPVD